MNPIYEIEKEEAPIRWSGDASSIVRRIRAFNPFPGATAVMQGETLKVWGAKVGNGATSEEYGRIVAVAPEGIAVAAMNSIVDITELQRPGGKRMAVSDFLRGMPLEVGAQFELQASAAPAT